MSEFVEKMNELIGIIDSDITLAEKLEDCHLYPTLNEDMKIFVDNLVCLYSGPKNDPESGVFRETPWIIVYRHPDYLEMVGIHYTYNSWGDHWIEYEAQIVEIKTRTVEYYG